MKTCPKCGQEKLEKEFYIDTDHDHTTGRVRGLLCRRCNLLVGLAENRGLHLTEAILDYIQPK